MFESKEDSVCQPLVLKDRLIEGKGCQAVWGFGNNLFAFAGCGKPNPNFTLQKDQVFVHQVQLRSDMDKGYMRKLANESHGVFLKLQTIEVDTRGKNPQLLKLSREYRAVLKAACEDIQQAIKTSKSTEEKQEMEQQIQVFCMIELVWNLAELLFVNTQTGGAVLSQLLEWLRWHFTEVDEMARRVAQDDNPAMHKDYWETIYRYVLQGRCDEAARFLSIHPQISSSPFLSLEELLRKMPLFSSFTGTSLSEFELRWRHWREECQARLMAGEFVTNHLLETVVRILVGDDEVFRGLRDVCENWYSMLASQLLYQNPTVKGNQNEWDHLIQATLAFDVLQIIAIASKCCSNWWFVAHLTDLLHHCNVLAPQKLFYGSTIREYLLLEYVGGLMSSSSLWETGASYLTYCDVFGRAQLQAYMESIDIRSEAKAFKVLSVCEKANLQESVRSICKVMGMRAYKRGRLGTALSWGLRCKDVGFVTYLAERYLELYSQQGNFDNLDLLDNLGSSMVLSGKLTFLAKYREFHRLYEKRSFVAAASLLLNLLTAKLAPQSFWLTLLCDALPLLQADELIFSQEQTYELLHCLEELSIARKIEKNSESQSQEAFDKDRISLLRLALAKNLARAIVTSSKTEP